MSLLQFFAQWIGGMVGIGFLKAITPEPWWKSCFAANFVHSDLTVGHAFFTEMLLTFFLMFVVMAACDSNKSNQTLVPFAIGMAVFCAHMIGLPITGCSINPTRTFASSVAASGVAGCNAWADHWVFWLGPLMGASLAGILYEYVYFGECCMHRCLSIGCLGVLLTLMSLYVALMQTAATRSTCCLSSTCRGKTSSTVLTAVADVKYMCTAALHRIPSRSS